LFVPWQQTIMGSGRVVAYDPAKRLQAIDAPVDGRLVKIYVAEGQHVQAGDPIADIADVDGNFLQRLQIDVNAVNERKRAAQDQYQAETRRLEAVRSSADQQILVAQARLAAAKEQLDAAMQSMTKAEADYQFAAEDYQIHKGLFEQGLEPERLYLQTRARYQSMTAEVKRTKAMVTVAEANLRAAESDVAVVRDNTSAMIESAQVSLKTAYASVQQAIRDEQTVTSRLARQENQAVRAPVAGVVYRVTNASANGSHLVKTGDPLAQLVPDTTNEELVVELMIDGRDAPLVQVGADARLQFEGWPAVQFMGWPSVAAGTFGGRVAWIDPANDLTGKCRILIEEAKHRPEDADWPHGTYLRQGNRANGWVFLQSVPLGFEIWRQVNGFPPVLADDEPGKGKDKIDTGYKKKAK
jgi:multidrug efflux pump subunit AcrA (membrane-fusion protein)